MTRRRSRQLCQTHAGEPASDAFSNLLVHATSTHITCPAAVSTRVGGGCGQCVQRRKKAKEATTLPRRQRCTDCAHRRWHALTSDVPALGGSRPKEMREAVDAFARGVVLAPVPLPTHLVCWIWRSRHGEEHAMHVKESTPVDPQDADVGAKEMHGGEPQTHSTPHTQKK